MKSFLLLLMVLFTLSLKANTGFPKAYAKDKIVASQYQTNPNSWPRETCEKANTAKNTTYLTEQEKMVIYYVNLVRLNPTLFSQTYLRDYKNRPGFKKNKYITSLEKDLNNIKPLQPLSPDQVLYKMAKEHAIESGKKGIVGHTGQRGKTFEKRAQAFLGDCDYASENCQYGYTDALDIVLDLLIDEGIADLGHRKNILSPKASLIGVSVQPHKTYKWNCVMDFGNKKAPEKRLARSL